MPELEGSNEVEVVVVTNISGFDAESLKIDLKALINSTIKKRELMGWSLEDVKGVFTSPLMTVVILVFWRPRAYSDLDEVRKDGATNQ